MRVGEIVSCQKEEKSSWMTAVIKLKNLLQTCELLNGFHLIIITFVSNFPLSLSVALLLSLVLSLSLCSVSLSLSLTHTHKLPVDAVVDGELGIVQTHKVLHSVHRIDDGAHNHFRKIEVQKILDIFGQH